MPNLLTRRNAILGISASTSVLLSRRISAQDFGGDGLKISSVSWIDHKNLPKLALTDVALGWPFKVMVGLVGTANPQPPNPLPNNFRSQKQFRALTEFRIDGAGHLVKTVIDPGYTPPINTTHLPTPVNLVAWWSDTGKFQAGESSSLSSIIAGALHPNSNLNVPTGYTVIASSLVKFRAGPETNKIGIETAGSPFHVPWVWNECAVVQSGQSLLLLASGSSFPSHAWYANGKQLGQLEQAPVKMEPTSPALSVGASVQKPQLIANPDNSTGPITTHKNTVPANSLGQISLNLSV